MASDYCLNMNCGHHRKDHSGTGHCRKCACRQGRYIEAEKGKLVTSGRRTSKKGGSGRAG